MRPRTLPHYIAVLVALLQPPGEAAAQDAAYAEPPLVAAVRAGDGEALDSLLAAGADLAQADSAGHTALYWAVHGGSTRYTRALLRAGADPAEPSPGWPGFSLLHLAAREGAETGVVRALLEAGLPADAVTEDGWTPLMLAAYNGHLITTVLLLDTGADATRVNADGATASDLATAQGHALTAAALDGLTPNHRLLLAIAESDTEAARRTLESGADPAGLSGTTPPLVAAARQRDSATVTLLLEYGADPDAATDGGWTALHYAARDDMAGVAWTLLEAGADADARTEDGWTPLGLAARNAQMGPLVLLVQAGADAGVANDEGLDPPALAARYGHDEAVAYLQAPSPRWFAIVHGALGHWDDVVRLVKDGVPFPGGAEGAAGGLRVAFQRRDTSAIRRLLDEGFPADVDLGDGWTPLHYAARDGLLREAARLVDLGAQVDAAKSDGWTPLMLAARNGQTAVLVALMEAGADTEARSVEGERAIDLARTHGHTAAAAYLDAPDAATWVWAMGSLGRWDRVASMLVTGERFEPTPGAHLNAVSLALAVDSTVRPAAPRDSAALPALLSAGWDPDTDLGNGWRALHMAARTNAGWALRPLLEAGADTELRTSSGRTPLMYAAALEGSLETALTLWEYGADLFAVDTAGFTAQDLARRRGRSNVALLLETLARTPAPEVVASARARGRRAWERSTSASDELDLREAFYEAVREGRDRLAAALLEEGVEVNGLIRDEEGEETAGRTALHAAASACHGSTVRVLLEAGADPFRRDAEGTNPWRAAAGAQCPERDEILRILAEGTADPDVPDEDGWTDLLWAASEGHGDAAILLLEAGADPEVAAEGGWTPLHYAAREGQTALVAALLRAGVPPDTPKDDGWTPLMLAAFNGHTWTALALREAGADPDLTNPDGQSAADLARQKGDAFTAAAVETGGDAWYLAASAATGRLDRVVELLDGGTPVDAILPGDWRPLHFAAREGATAVVNTLLLRGADADAAKDDGWTPLMLAAHNGHYGPAVLLLASGADGTRTNAEGADAADLAAAANQADVSRLLGQPWADFHLAEYAAQGWTEQVEELLSQGVDADTPNPWGVPPLYFAARFGRTESARALLEAGADAAAALDIPALRSDTAALRVLAEAGVTDSILSAHTPPSTGATASVLDFDRAAAVWMAIAQGPDTLAAHLANGMEHAGAGWPGGDPLLVFALRMKRPATALALLRAGADPSAPGTDGRTAVDFAVAEEYTEVLRALAATGNPDAVAAAGALGLSEAGAESEEPATAAATGRPETARSFDPMVGLQPEVRALFQAAREGDVPGIDSLLARGVDPNATDGSGVTPLWRAVAGEHLGAVQRLIAAGADVDAPGLRDRTPLGEALRLAQPRIAQALLDAGADPATPDRNGVTPLHWSAEDGPHVGGWTWPGVRLAVLQRLLAAGADPDASSTRSRTPLHHAALEGSEFAAAMLVCAGADPTRTDEEGASPAELASQAGSERLATWLEAPDCPPQLPQALALHARAWNAYLLGDLGQAEAEARAAMASFEASVGREHAFWRTTASFHAALALELGLEAEALASLDAISALPGLAPEDIEAMRVRARRLAARGQYGAASGWISMARGTADVQWTEVSPLALARARALASLTDAEIARAAGDRERARAVVDEVMATVPSAMGFAVMREVLQVRAALEEGGNPTGMRRVYEALLGLESAQHPPRHPHVWQTLAALGRTYRAEGERADAADLLASALRSARDSYGPGHPALSPLLAAVAGAILDGEAPAQERFDQAAVALRLIERAEEIQEDLVSLAHPTTIGFAVAHALASGHMLDALDDLGEPGSDWDPALVATAAAMQRDLGWLKAASAALGLSLYADGSLRMLSVTAQRAFLDRYYTPVRDAVLTLGRGRTDFAQGYGGLFALKGRLVHGIREQTALLLAARGNPEVAELVDVRRRIAEWSRTTEEVDSRQRAILLDRLTARKEELESTLGQEGAALEDPLGNLDDFRASLPPDAAFIDVYEYADGEDVRYAAVVTARTAAPVLVDLGPALDIDPVVEAWRDDVVSGGSGSEAWTALRSALWNPVQAVLPTTVRRAWLSPDGLLARIPWHLLPPAGGTRLVQVGSARELAILLQDDGGRPSAEVDLALVGGIDFDAGLEAPPARRRFAPLPGTAEEISAIEALAAPEGLSVRTLRGEDAAPRSVADLMARARVAHLATHGFFDRSTQRGAGSRSTEIGGAVDAEPPPPGRNPLVETGLALSGANGEGGTLTAEEIIGLDLSATQLVVLSACETGRGTEVSGQGVMGLQASLAAAGARSLLMSLWKVPDASTAMLMTEFYRALLDEGASPVEALERAQEAVRSDPRFAAPVHWAAWVLVGDAFDG